MTCEEVEKKKLTTPERAGAERNVRKCILFTNQDLPEKSS